MSAVNSAINSGRLLGIGWCQVYLQAGQAKTFL